MNKTGLSQIWLYNISTKKLPDSHSLFAKLLGSYLFRASCFMLEINEFRCYEEKCLEWEKPLWVPVLQVSSNHFTHSRSVPVRDVSSYKTFMWKLLRLCLSH